jgi:hypothetical protein
VVTLLLIAALASPQVAQGRTALVTVRDAQGRPFVDVDVDDFVVREGGRSRDVLMARIADYPVVIVIDNSDAAARDFEVIRQAAVRFITRLGQRPVAVRALTDPQAPVASFEDDRTALLRKIQALKPGGASRMLETLADASRTTRATEAPFAALVVISAGISDAPVDNSGGLLAETVDSRATVHAVAVRSPGQSRAGDLLHDLSDQTRGRFTTIFSAASFQAALDRLADQFASEMMVEYLVPPGAGPGGDVKIGVQVPGLRVEGQGVR